MEADRVPSRTINGILAMESFRLQFSTGHRNPDTEQPDLSTSQSSLVVAILSIGSIVGALLAAPFSDFWGRRKALIISIAVFSLGVIFQVASADIPWLLAGRYVVPRAKPLVGMCINVYRFFAGLGIGAISVIVPSTFSHFPQHDFEGRTDKQTSSDRVLFVYGETDL